jgi:hypothetical protein
MKQINVNGRMVDEDVYRDALKHTLKTTNHASANFDKVLSENIVLEEEFEYMLVNK